MHKLKLHLCFLRFLPWQSVAMGRQGQRLLFILPLPLLIFSLQLSALSPLLASPSIYVPFRWTVNTSRPAKQKIEIMRGETVALEPRYLTYGSPVDLTNCTSVVLRYRTSAMAAGYYYAATGTVINATNGQVQIIWGPDQETTATNYTYDIKLTGADSASLKARGTIKLIGDISVTYTNVPTTVWAGLTNEIAVSISALSNNLTVAYTAADAALSNALAAAQATLSNNLVVAYGAADVVLSNALATGYASADAALSNALTAAYAAADTTLSNALAQAYATADTSLSNSLAAAFAAADVAVSNNLVTMFQSADLVISNAFRSADSTLSNNMWSAFQAADTIVSNALHSAITNLQDQVATIENDYLQPNARGNVFTNFLYLLSSNCTIAAGLTDCTIAGGRDSSIGISAGNSTICGGYFHAIGNSAYSSSILGGYNNSIGNLSHVGTIGGGQQNYIYQSAPYASILGGLDNRIGFNSWYATALGGRDSTIGSNASYSVVIGSGANVVPGHDHSVVISTVDQDSQGTNSFAARFATYHFYDLSGECVLAISNGTAYLNGVEIATNAFTLAEGLTLSNRVTVLETNTATFAQGVAATNAQERVADIEDVAVTYESYNGKATWSQTDSGFTFSFDETNLFLLLPESRGGLQEETYYQVYDDGNIIGQLGTNALTPAALAALLDDTDTWRPPAPIRFSLGTTNGWGGDEFPVGCVGTQAVDITEIRMYAVGATGIVCNIEERSNPNVPGTDILTADIYVTTAGVTITTFANTNLAAYSTLVFTTPANAESGTVSAVTGILVLE